MVTVELEETTHLQVVVVVLDLLVQVVVQDLVDQQELYQENLIVYLIIYQKTLDKQQQVAVVEEVVQEQVEAVEEVVLECFQEVLDRVV